MIIESDERYTPERVLDVVRAFDRIALDPCTTRSNPVGADSFFTREADGLSLEWGIYVLHSPLVFINPPYSRGQLILWVRKCVDSDGLDRIALIPSDLGSKAGALAASTADALCFVKGRLAFGSPEGQLEQGAKQPSVLVYWGDRGKRFARVFAEIGIVWRR